jgi:ribosomal protein L32E
VLVKRKNGIIKKANEKGLKILNRYKEKNATK